ncbi:unnamed protein product [Mycena citricolor]|uniref:Uncharacterized protein n=1 Tax=Mycena citricolor TaxID=2018698 RepID=A0AAD2GW56_9AGAR|nr:unnamed protein product [Mycena citricolor]
MAMHDGAPISLASAEMALPLITSLEIRLGDNDILQTYLFSGDASDINCDFVTGLLAPYEEIVCLRDAAAVAPEQLTRGRFDSPLALSTTLCCSTSSFPLTLGPVFEASPSVAPVKTMVSMAIFECCVLKRTQRREHLGYLWTVCETGTGRSAS